MPTNHPPSPSPRPRGARPGDSRRVLYVNRVCYLDDSNGAAVASRSLLELLHAEGFAVEALTGAVIEAGPETDPAAWQAERGLRAPGPVTATVAARRVVRGVPATILLGHATRHGEPSDAEGRDFLALLDEAIARFRPDVLLTFGGDRLSGAVRARARRRGVAVVFALHNFAYNVRWPFANVDAAIVPSEFAADHYRRSIGLDCTVLPNPVARDRVCPARIDPRYLTFVNPSPEKGVYPFARIADELACRRPDIPLLVVEARGSERTLAGCGLDLAARGTVSLMSHTDDPRLFWGLTRVCLMPSVWWESQGLVAVEALMNGLPVVASDRGALPETLGRAGVVLPLPDRIRPDSALLPTADEVAPWVEAIIQLWDDEEARDEQSRLARVEARRWQPAVVAGRAAQFFARVRPAGAFGHPPQSAPPQRERPR